MSGMIVDSISNGSVYHYWGLDVVGDLIHEAIISWQERESIRLKSCDATKRLIVKPPQRKILRSPNIVTMI